jgi:hypothetical protein
MSLVLRGLVTDNCCRLCRYRHFEWRVALLPGVRPDDPSR